MAQQYYDKPKHELMYDFFAEMKKQNMQVFKKDEFVEKFNKKYPLFKVVSIERSLVRFSVNNPNRRIYKPKEKDNILWKIDSQTLRFYDKEKDFIDKNDNITNKKSECVEKETNDEINTSFAFEKDLQNYLIKNLSEIEPGMELFIDDNGVKGIEYSASGRFIDILALDKNKNFVVIELKVSLGHEKVIGQLLRYKTWVQENLAKNDQTVRGIIICRNITEDLRLACKGLSNIELFEYSLLTKLSKKNL